MPDIYVAGNGGAPALLIDSEHCEAEPSPRLRLTAVVGATVVRPGARRDRRNPAERYGVIDDGRILKVGPLSSI